MTLVLIRHPYGCTSSCVSAPVMPSSMPTATSFCSTSMLFAAAATSEWSTPRRTMDVAMSIVHVIVPKRLVQMLVSVAVMLPAVMGVPAMRVLNAVATLVL